MPKTDQIIPILDCSRVGLGIAEESIKDADVKSFGDLIKDALATSGFCYLQNHGVDKKLIENYLEVSRKFFAMPVEVKRNFAHTKEKNFGWIPSEKESFNPERPGDLKEAFNFFPADDTGDWPEVEDFGHYSRQMYQTCTALAKRLCDCLSMGLGLDRSFMANAHGAMGNRNNNSTLRTLYYPPIDDDSAVKPGQIRLGEHADYGTMTLLFQDDAGGLEANVPGQGFVPVTPIPDTIVVNIGELMQRWTSDQLLATKHRVFIPEVEERRRKARQSVAFFLASDDDFVVETLDGSGKYPPVSTIDYLREKFNTYFL